MKSHLDPSLVQRLGWEPGGLRIAYVSSYPPRECGIATFCQDLVTSTKGADGAGEPMIIAMESAQDNQAYERPVTLTVDDKTPLDYEAAADYINGSSAKLVCLQHEFGIFGGTEERSLYLFLNRLEKPLVATLHTVTPRPTQARIGLMRELSWRADRLVVMNRIAKDLLVHEYGISARKVIMIHHGAPEFPRAEKEPAKARLGLEGRTVMSTFGLVSRGKGIEYALEALPQVVARYPEVLYLIIGKTHPSVQRYEKESYRDELCRRIAELGLENNVRFINHYLTKAEIIEYLAATDIYVTPYLNPEQITSGTMAYAVAAGKAIVSTPYLYARFLLEEGRGILVDFRDGAGLAEAFGRILDNPALQHHLENLTYSYGRGMLWSVVGRQYMNLYRQVLAEQDVVVATAPAVAPLAATAQLREENLHGHLRPRKTSIA